MDPSDYFGNMLRVSDHVIRRELRRLMEGTPKTSWFEELAPTDINAFYAPSLNQFSKSMQIYRLSPQYTVDLEIFIIKFFCQQSFPTKIKRELFCITYNDLYKF